MFPDKWICQYCKAKHQRDENATKNLLEYENYTKIVKKYVHNSNLNQSSENQAELKLNTKIKLPESSGENKTVEMCKTQVIPMNNLSNISETVNSNIH